jgi:hypothetical protein
MKAKKIETKRRCKFPVLNKEGKEKKPKLEISKQNWAIQKVAMLI